MKRPPRSTAVMGAPGRMGAPTASSATVPDRKAKDKMKDKEKERSFFEPIDSPARVSMTALLFSETDAQRAERAEAGIKLPSSRERSVRSIRRDKVPKRFGDDRPLILDTPDEGVGTQAQGEFNSEAAGMLAKMKKLIQTNRQLQRQARELRSAHSRVEKLERQVALMQQELRTSEETGASDSQALEEEHAELTKLVAESQAAASAALQEMAAVELKVMRAIRGEWEEAQDTEGEWEAAQDTEGTPKAGRGGSRRSMQNDCVASVSSFSEGGAYALSASAMSGTDSTGHATCFTCFTSTKVQTLTQKALRQATRT